MGASDQVAPEDHDPPIEPPGVRSDLLEHPDPAAIARSFAPRSGDSATVEDPPREADATHGDTTTSAVGSSAADTEGAAAAEDADPPAEWD